MHKLKQKIMGILNVTPDSFSDGGSFSTVESAIMRGKQMIEQGADIIDIGGESTRPGAKRKDANQQIKRVVGVIAQVKKYIGENNINTKISIDTTLAQVAKVALNSGASIINDVSAGREDENMFNLAAKRNVPIIIMHMQGEPASMQENPHYENVVSEVKEFLLKRAAIAQASGVKKENITIDPGIGFGKNQEHDTALLKNLSEFVKTGYKVMLGSSRKRILGELITKKCKPSERIGATCATTVLGAQAGVTIFRVHDVQENKQALDVALAVNNG